MKAELFYFYIYILLVLITIIFTVDRSKRNNYIKCIRKYPTVNLMENVSNKCKYSPFNYSYHLNNDAINIEIDFLLETKKKNKQLLFYTVIDDNSFMYIINLYKIFLIPYNIHSLLTIVFYKKTLIKCIRYRIFCVYKEWPEFIKKATDISIKKRLWFLKYYYYYYIIKTGISLLYIDSDVVFINNCLEDIANRKEDIVLLKSQLSPNKTFGNSGLWYCRLYYLY